MEKSQSERLAECLTLRKKWIEQIGAPFPYQLVERMNEFIKEGQPSSGSMRFYGKSIEYGFTTHKGKETFVRLFSRSE